MPGEPDAFATGSADRTLKLWRGTQCLRTLEGHTDVVRSLIPLSATRLISAGNDSSIKLWNLEEGKLAAEYFTTYSEYIYS